MKLKLEFSKNKYIRAHQKTWCVIWGVGIGTVLYSLFPKFILYPLAILSLGWIFIFLVGCVYSLFFIFANMAGKDTFDVGFFESLEYFFDTLKQKWRNRHDS